MTGDQQVTYDLAMDAVFRALSDPTRRSLLDALFEEDGQSLGSLERRLPMTRFGVMKHLKVLEQAAARRVGEGLEHVVHGPDDR